MYGGWLPQYDSMAKKVAAIQKGFGGVANTPPPYSIWIYADTLRIVC